MRNHENLRRNIIKAADSAFKENGFYETDMRMIAKLANIGVGTIYNYFSGKKELFNTVLIEKWSMFQGGLRDILGNQSDDFEKRLASLCECVGSFIVEHRRLCKELQFSPQGLKLLGDHPVRSIAKEFQQAFEKFVGLAIERREIYAVAPSVAAVTIIGVISNYFFSFSDNGVTLEDDAKFIAQIISNGLNACLKIKEGVSNGSG